MEQAIRYATLLLDISDESHEAFDELLIERNSRGVYWIHFAVKPKLARAIHDHSIHRSLMEFMEPRNPNRCVGIMGGHAIKRSDPMFEKVVLMSKRLTEEGFLMVSGGGLKKS